MDLEGGAAVVDNGDGGGTTKFGITQRWNPNVDVRNLTYEGAARIARSRYWQPSYDRASPATAAIAFDAGYIHSMEFARTLATRYANDPAGALSAYRARLNSVARGSPRHARFERPWNNRLDRLASFIGVAPGGGRRRRQGGAGDGYDRPAPAPEPAKDFSGDWLNMRPADLSQRPMPEHVNSHTDEVDRQRRLQINTGRDNLYTGHQAQTQEIAQADTERREHEAVVETDHNNTVMPWDRMWAAIRDNALTASIVRAVDDTYPEADEGFPQYYLNNIEEIERFAHNSEELSELRAATSEGGLQLARRRIEAQRERRSLYMGSGASTTGAILYGLMGGLLDPVGWVAGAGVGKVLQLGGIGARTLYQAGRPLAGTLAMAGEGAIGNVVVMGAMDTIGDHHFTTRDYAAGAAFGAVIGLGLSPFVGRGNRPDTSTLELFEGIKARGIAETTELVRRAQNNLGPDATPDQIGREAVRLDRFDTDESIRVSLAEQPDELRLHNAENIVTGDEAARAAVVERHGLDRLSDDAERSIIAELTARSERIDADNPLNRSALNPATLWVDQQSTGIDLLRSGSVVARAIGRVLTEGTTGAGGRRRTAAMSQAVRERIYNQEIAEFTDLYHLFRREQGRGIVGEAMDGRVWKQFEKRVFMELERRGGTTKGTLDAHPLVTRAADLFENGFNKMRVEQQHVDAVGSARLGTSSRGYVPHRILGTAIMQLSNDQQRGLRKVLSKQFQNGENGFDKKFSDKLATRYLEQAQRRALGGYDVPANLHTSEAADIVRDSLEAMKLPAAEIEKLMGKYSRGGAGHTKRRLRLDLDEDIGGGVKLADLFDTSITGLYRGYARRVSGEVSLAQFGIMGRKGLMLARTAIESTGGDAKALRAFDQVAAEFLNTPFGNWNHKYMDNLRIATSLSRLGGMGFTQLGEYGNGLAALGVHRTFAAISALPRLVKEVRGLRRGEGTPNPILASLDDLGGRLGMDEYTNTRLFDVRDNDVQIYGTEQIGLGTRLLRAGGNLQAVMSGHKIILAVQTRGMAEQIIRKAVHYARRGGDDKALDDMGINATLRQRLAANMDQIATFKGGKLDTLDLRAGDLTGHEIMQIRDAVERGAAQIIQRTYTGETGKWAHNGFLKMLLQFRTFGLTAVEKQWGRNRANFGAIRSLATLMGAMSFAAPIHMARVQTKMIGMDEAEADEYAERHLNVGAISRATLNYASSAGLLGDVLDVGTSFTGSVTGTDLGQSYGARGGGRGSLLGGVAAPGVGLIEDVWAGATNLRNGEGEWREHSLDKLRRALPFANLPYVQPAVNALTDD
jgi:hypothetical protein